jgi:hypothetical protein
MNCLLKFQSTKILTFKNVLSLVETFVLRVQSWNNKRFYLLDCLFKFRNSKLVFAYYYYYYYYCIC